MNAKHVIEEAMNRLLDEHDEDPRSPLIRNLKQILDEPDVIPDTEIELTAILQPGGVYKVHDQHGRTLKGVKSVAAFPEQGGQTVFQVNL